MVGWGGGGGGGIGLFVGFGKEGWWVDGSGCSVGCICIR